MPGAEFDGAGNGGPIVGCGAEHNMDRSEHRGLLDPAEKFQAVRFRHRDIEEDDVEVALGSSSGVQASAPFRAG